MFSEFHFQAGNHTSICMAWRLYSVDVSTRRAAFELSQEIMVFDDFEEIKHSRLSPLEVLEDSKLRRPVVLTES